MNVHLAGALLLATLAAFAADIWLVADDKRLELWGGWVWGYFALFGLAFCVAMIGFAKMIGHFWLQRPDDYYSEDEQGDE
jgi:hypothetical protein